MRCTIILDFNEVKMTDETRRKISKAVKISLIIAGILLICNDVYWRWHGRSSTPADNDVARTVEQLQDENESARSELESAGREIADAEGHVERAADAVGRSEEAAQRNADSVEELQGIVSECREIVEAQQRLIRNIDESNRT